MNASPVTLTNMTLEQSADSVYLKATANTTVEGVTFTKDVRINLEGGQLLKPTRELQQKFHDGIQQEVTRLFQERAKAIVNEEEPRIRDILRRRITIMADNMPLDTHLNNILRGELKAMVISTMRSRVDALVDAITSNMKQA